MSRRMDREGVQRVEVVRVRNKRFWKDPRCKENERGWVEPFTVWQGWDELNHAFYALRRAMLFRQWPDVWSPARVESDLRDFHSHFAKSRQCDRPKLP